MSVLELDPELQRQLDHAGAHHNYSGPWSAEDVYRYLGDKLEPTYTRDSIQATPVECVIRICYAHVVREQCDPYDRPALAAAMRVILEIEEATPTLQLTMAAWNDRQTIPASEVARRSLAKPTIKIGIERAPVVNAAEEALITRGGVYVRGRTLVHVVHDAGAVEASDWIRRAEGVPLVAALAEETLLERLGESARWVRGSGEDERVIMTPAWVAKTLAARGEWSLPVLDAIVTTPTLRRDGTLLERQGYDSASRLLYEASDSFPPVPEAPRLHDAKRALAELMDPFCDVCAIGEHDRSAIAAAILTLIARPMIDGPVPMFGVVAPTPGSGKGLVVDLVSLIATGNVASTMSATDDEDENRKRLLALAFAGDPLIVLDNIEGELRSAVLAMALTSGRVSERVLGKSEQVSIPLRGMWMYTGNNVALGGDLGRRVVPVRLDPKMEHPEDRTGFRYPDVRTHVRAIRPRLVVAALTILRAYVAAGRPAHSKPAKGSYESWDGVIRGAMLWLGAADPLAGVAELRTTDSDLDRLGALLGTWHTLYGESAKTLREIVSAARWDERLAEVIEPYGGQHTTKLGNGLRKVRGRPAGGLQLVAGEKTASNVATYKVVQVRDSGTSGTSLPQD